MNKIKLEVQIPFQLILVSLNKGREEAKLKNLNSMNQFLEILLVSSIWAVKERDRLRVQIYMSIWR